MKTRKVLKPACKGTIPEEVIVEAIRKICENRKICYREMPEGSGNMVQRYVVCAANRSVEGRIVCSARHGDPIMRAGIKHYSSNNLRNWEEGFIDQFGTWMDREEALIVARHANQIRRRCGGDDKRLFSENLY